MMAVLGFEFRLPCYNSDRKYVLLVSIVSFEYLSL
jgi:hypothetical protein